MKRRFRLEGLEHKEWRVHGTGPYANSPDRKLAVLAGLAKEQVPHRMVTRRLVTLLGLAGRLGR